MPYLPSHIRAVVVFSNRERLLDYCCFPNPQIPEGLKPPQPPSNVGPDYDIGRCKDFQAFRVGHICDILQLRVFLIIENKNVGKQVKFSPSRLAHNCA